jgi:PEP-CTERM motif
MRMSTLICTLTITLACAPAAQAALIGYEGFAGYTPGAALSGQAGTGNIGFAPASNWGVAGAGTGEFAEAASLSYTNGGTLLTSGGSSLSGASNSVRQLAATLPTSSTTGEELWVSYLFKSGANIEDTNIVRFYQFSDSSGVSQDRISLDATRGGSPGMQQMRLGHSTNSNAAVGGLGLFKPAGQVNLLVMQFVLDDANTAGGQGIMRGYLNPVIGGAAPAIGSAVVVASNIPTWNGPNALRLFSPGGPANAAFRVTRDELRWGTTFADVTPVVPEPATCGLFAMALAGLVAMRRRSS